MQAINKWYCLECNKEYSFDYITFHLEAYKHTGRLQVIRVGYITKSKK